MDACTNPDILNVIYFFQLILDIVKIIIPIGLIVMGMIDFSKSVITNDENIQKKTISLFIKRIIYGVLVFIVPWIVETLMIWLGNITGEVNFTDCLENTEYIDHYENLNAEKETQNTTTLIKEINEANKSEDFSLKDGKKEGTSTDGTFIGTKYSLTDDQIKRIARLCQQEQGTPIGAAAEASLMANLLELHYSNKYGKDAAGLHNFIRDEGWFAYAKAYMGYEDLYKDGKLKKTKEQIMNELNPKVVTEVYNVLKLGIRTLPLYVDEHDCIYCGKDDHGNPIYNIDWIKLDGKTITDVEGRLNRDNYKRDKTIIHNNIGKDGTTYTFSIFPTETSDPFGYTKEAYNKYKSLKNE